MKTHATREAETLTSFRRGDIKQIKDACKKIKPAFSYWSRRKKATGTVSPLRAAATEAMKAA